MEQNTGAFICDENVFNRILRLEKRRGDKFLFMVTESQKEINNKTFIYSFANEY